MAIDPLLYTFLQVIFVAFTAITALAATGDFHFGITSRGGVRSRRSALRKGPEAGSALLYGR